MIKVMMGETMIKKKVMVKKIMIKKVMDDREEGDDGKDNDKEGRFSLRNTLIYFFFDFVDSKYFGG